MEGKTLTLEAVQALLENANNKMMKHMNEQFSILNTSIQANRDLILAASTTADEAKLLAERNTKRLDYIDTKILEFEEEKNRLAEQNALQTIQINVLTRRLEDQTNRNSRNSIVIRGLPESEGGEKSWDMTREVVCDALAPLLQINPIDISRKIERIHRGPHNNDPNKNRNNNTPRLVHARLFNWNDAQWIINTSFKNRKNSTIPIYVEQRYGPDTTYRRQEALKFRKELKERKEIVGGYLKYPAKLYVKLPGTEKYTLHQDFSDIPVVRKS